jgi:hypothetical protein
MTTNPLTAIQLYQQFGTPVYPGHPIALACYTLIENEGFETSAPKTVAASKESLQATAAMLGRLQRGEAIETALKWAGDWWARAIRSHRPAFDARLEPGQEQAAAMEPLFRQLVEAARESLPAPAPEAEPEPESADAEPRVV